jgi:hypothetical protein
MDMAIGNAHRGLEERYLSAGNSGDLTLRAGRLGDVDALVQMAWSRGRLGQALLQLTGEWDAAARRGLRFEQAFLQMKSLPLVRGAMFIWAMGDAPLPPREHQLQDADDLSWSILMWWLERTCTDCCGTGWVSQRAAPKKPCTSCHGKGEKRIPRGEAGRALVTHLEQCVYQSRQSARGRAAR